MWLLNTKTGRLEQFLDETEVFNKYAILSHTWGQEEPTFQDMQNGGHNARQKIGYAKVQYALQQSVKDSLDFVWVDTICIDKTSSADLSEAINSMYRWYKFAAVCYAYLEDVSGDCPQLHDQLVDLSGRAWDAFEDNVEVDSGAKSAPVSIAGPSTASGGGNWHTMFARSKWFTRGWTLQELIAPRFVEFFGQAWNYLGPKTALFKSLATITAIPIQVLRYPSSVSEASIAQKMSWAAGRSTTRREDQAYSLLGLFDINMPLLYGEGRKAFVRLQEELIRRSNDLSLLAWNSLEYEKTSALVFASFPRDFADAGKVVRYRKEELYGRCELSSQGLRVEIPVLASEDGLFAVLNCYYEDDLSGPIALRLRQVAEYVPPAPLKACVETLGAARMHTIAQNEAQLAEMREVVILTATPSSESQDYWSMRMGDTRLRAPPLRLLCNTMLSGGWELLATSPRDLWNTTTRVMCPPWDAGGQPTLAYAKFGKGSTQFVLCFAYTAWGTLWNIAVLERDDTTTPQQMLKSLTKQNESLKVVRCVDETFMVCAEVHLDRAMGTKVFMMHISVDQIFHATHNQLPTRLKTSQIHQWIRRRIGNA